MQSLQQQAKDVEATLDDLSSVQSGSPKAEAILEGLDAFAKVAGEHIRETKDKGALTTPLWKQFSLRREQAFRVETTA
eukprot:SAG11_NODE_3394_length_2474_cov_1.136421_2_plen_78_part_00